MSTPAPAPGSARSANRRPNRISCSCPNKTRPTAPTSAALPPPPVWRRRSRFASRSYDIVSGPGLYALDDKQYDVAAGDALLMRPGSTHALQQTGEQPLVLLLAYTASK
ncbi:cupin domain-containing protein [Xanthomonas oryzae pv. oryzae]|nr:cupin domain-containing protein [Xanthomonas oryzae pv. oryzae]